MNLSNDTDDFNLGIPHESLHVYENISREFRSKYFAQKKTKQNCRDKRKKMR